MNDNEFPFELGTGVLAAAIRSNNWETTPLGAPGTWPQSLRTLVGVMLASTQPMFMAWGPSRVWFYNDAFIPILGKKHPQALGRPAIDEVWAEAKDALQPLFDRVFSGVPVHMEDFALDLDRNGKLEEAHFAFSYTPARDEAGKVAGLFGTCIEITGQILAQRSLLASQARQRRMFEQAPGFICIVEGPEHTFTFVNNAHRQLFDSNDWVGKPVREAFPDLAEQGYYEKLDAVYATGQRYVAKAAPVRYPSFWGEAFQGARLLDFIYEPVTDETGKVTGIFCEGFDVTEAHLADMALLEQTKDLEVLNRVGTALSANLDLRMIVQAVTDAATEVSGAKFGSFFYTMTGPEGDAFLLFSLSGAPREAFEKLGHPRATAIFAPTFNGEAIIRSDDITADPRYGGMGPHHGMPKGHLPVRSYLAVPVVSKSNGVIGGLFFGHPETGVFTERSERLVAGIASQAAIAIDNVRLLETSQRLADEREKLLSSERAARSAAERASDVKDQFLATLSHELRTPLSAILGWTTLLRRGVHAEKDRERALETIERNARVQTQLIDDLLDMSRIASGKLRLDVQMVEPISFIEAAIETVRPAANAKGVRLAHALDPFAARISGDPQRLQQVIWNLLANAIKFTPRDGKVQISLERVNSHLEINVADTGIGIEPDFLPHVFERFQQQDASTTRKYGGLGLGLSIAKQLIEMHGGSIHVKSAGLGKGTTFSVHLPVSIIDRREIAEGRQHPSAPVPPATFGSSDLAGLRILAVDDEPDARGLLQRILEESGATVEVAGDAMTALQMAGSLLPDVLITDIGMPEMDGFEFLRRLRALKVEGAGTVPVVALTAFARSEDRTRALRAGFWAHMSKPVEPAELVATVASLVGRTLR